MAEIIQEHNEENIVEEVREEAVETQELSHEATLYAEPVAHLGNFQITNALVTSWVAVLFIVLIAFTIKAKIKEVPTGIQNFFEAILEGALDLCDQVTGDRKISQSVFPLAFSVFLFILVNNWLGLLPLGGLGVVHQGEHGAAFIPFLRSGTADINTTLGLAVMAVVAANIFGIISIGAWKAFNKYINLRGFGKVFTHVRKDPTVLVVAPVNFFVGVLELIGEFAKIASLSFRLFGNIFAGEVLLISMAAILPYILPVPFLFLEIFVGLIQSLIFAILVLVYFTIAAQDHDHDDNMHEEDHAHGEAHA